MLDEFREGVRVLKQIDREGKRMWAVHGRREGRAKKMLGRLKGLERDLKECNEEVLEVHCRIYEPGAVLDEIDGLQEVESAGQGCVVCGGEGAEGTLPVDPAGSASSVETNVSDGGDLAG